MKKIVFLFITALAGISFQYSALAKNSKESVCLGSDNKNIQAACKEIEEPLKETQAQFKQPYNDLRQAFIKDFPIKGTAQGHIYHYPTFKYNPYQQRQTKPQRQKRPKPSQQQEQNSRAYDFLRPSPDSGGDLAPLF